MMGVSSELNRAVTNLRKAAEAEFTGNAYYQAANQIVLLIEIMGPAEQSAAPSGDAAQDFATMLAEVRRGVESDLSGNRFYLAANKLEELASFANPVVQMPGQRAPVFAELAAASAARVETTAASLGIMIARHPLPPHSQSAETLADGELERRSSEPCLMAELAPPVLAPVASAPILTEAAAPASSGEAAQGLGSPAAPGGHGAVQGTDSPAAAAYPAATPAPHHSAPANDSASPSAGQTVKAADDPAAAQPAEEAAFYLGSPAAGDASLEEEGVRLDIASAEAERGALEPAAGPETQGNAPEEIKHKEPKTLFKLWLDLAFGRKD